MTHDDFIIASYAAAAIVWVGLLADTLYRVWKARRRD